MTDPQRLTSVGAGRTSMGGAACAWHLCTKIAVAGLHGAFCRPGYGFWGRADFGHHHSGHRRESATMLSINFGAAMEFAHWPMPGVNGTGTPCVNNCTDFCSMPSCVASETLSYHAPSICWYWTTLVLDNICVRQLRIRLQLLACSTSRAKCGLKHRFLQQIQILSYPKPLHFILLCNSAVLTMHYDRLPLNKTFSQHTPPQLLPGSTCQACLQQHQPARTAQHQRCCAHHNATHHCRQKMR